MAYYAVLVRTGFIPEAWLAGWASFDSPLGHHPDRNLVPGVEISSAARSGTGCRSAVGTALGLRAQGIGARVVVLVGDAELDEGSNHEALELAAALGLDALTVVVVDNRITVVRRARAGSPSGSPTEGWRSPRPSTAATTTPWRRPCPNAASDGRTPSSPVVERREHDDPTRDPRTQFAPHRRRPARRGPRRSRWSTPRSPASSSADAERRHPDRVVNVGIREQLLVNVGAGWR